MGTQNRARAAKRWCGDLGLGLPHGKGVMMSLPPPQTWAQRSRAGLALDQGPGNGRGTSRPARDWGSNEPSVAGRRMAEDKEETHVPRKQETTICKHMTTKRFMRRSTETPK